MQVLLYEKDLPDGLNKGGLKILPDGLKPLSPLPLIHKTGRLD